VQMLEIYFGVALDFQGAVESDLLINVQSWKNYMPLLSTW